MEGLGEELSNVDFTNPDAVREAYQNMTTEVTRLAPLAPPEIAASVEDTVAGFQQLNDALAAVEYDLLNADLTIIDELDAEMQAATDDIDQYNFDVCGIPLDDDDGEDGSDFDPSAGTIREQAIGELVNQGFTADEAECIFDKLDFTDPDLSSDQAAMIQIFDDCGIDLGRLAEIGGLGG